MKKFIRTVYHKDGTISREVVGLKGEACLTASEPYNRHLHGYEQRPTAEMYESETVTEGERETQ
jgi:hypothetical protein